MHLYLSLQGEHNPSPSSVSFDQSGGWIGRSAENTWVLPDETRTVSSRHAQISFSDGAFTIHDHSTNGVFVNDADRPLGPNRSHRLAEGDHIRIGDYLILTALTNELPANRPDTQMGHTYANASRSPQHHHDLLGGNTMSATDPLELLSSEPIAPEPDSVIPDHWDFTTQADPLSRPDTTKIVPSSPFMAEPSPTDGDKGNGPDGSFSLPSDWSFSRNEDASLPLGDKMTSPTASSPLPSHLASLVQQLVPFAAPAQPNPTAQNPFAEPAQPNPTAQNPFAEPAQPNPTAQNPFAEPAQPNPAAQNPFAEPAQPNPAAQNPFADPAQPNPTAQNPFAEPAQPNPAAQNPFAEPAQPNPAAQNPFAEPAQPNPAAQNPFAEPAQPNPAAQNPFAEPAQPNPAAQNPFAEPAQPNPAAQNPFAEPAQPNPTAQNPFAEPAQPNPAAQNPFAAPAQPNPTAQNPFAAPAQPNPTAQNPFAAPAQPNPTAQNPFAEPAQPNPTAQNPLAAPAQPNPIAQNPLAAPAQPNPIAQNSLAAPAQPNPIAQNPLAAPAQPNPIAQPAPPPTITLQDMLWHQIGVSPSHDIATQSAMTATIGRALQHLSARLPRLLANRKNFVRESHPPQRRTDTHQNNPFHSARNGSDALRLAFSPQHGEFLPLDTALDDALQDLQAFDIAMMQAIRAAQAALIERFDPNMLARRLNVSSNWGWLRRMFPLSLCNRAWPRYCREFNALATESSASFYATLNKEWVRAYRAHRENPHQESRHDA